MAIFYYKAINNAKKTVEGKIESSSIQSARDALMKQNLRPITIGKERASVKNLNSLFKKKLKSKDLVVFTRQLSTMVSAGVPLLRSLNTLENQTENPKLKDVVSKIGKSIEGGGTLADALGNHPEVFSGVYVNMVRAGEAGGILDDILDKLALQQEKDASIKTKFKSAMTYPTVLLGITVVVFIGLMTFVIPNLAKVITEIGGEGSDIPTLTKIMLSVSDFMTSRWYVLVGIIALASYALRRFLKKPSGILFRDKLILKTPVLNTIIKKIAIARFSRIFASLMGSGVTVIECLNVTSKAIGNEVIAKELLGCAREISTGKTLSYSLSKSKIFPPIISQMLAIGEETGKIDSILLKVADFYEEEVDATLGSLGSIIEPIMIVTMGGMVGLVAASVLGPITSLANQIN